MSSHGVFNEDRVVTAYENWLRSWASERTTSARTRFAKRRLHAWGLEGFTVVNVQTFLAGPVPKSGQKPWSRWTKATYHGHMTDLCKWMAAAELITVNPMEDVRSVRRPGNNPNPLSEAEVARVLSVVSGTTRDWIVLALLAGLRAHEIAKISGEDVTVDGVRVEGKGGTNVTLPCHPDIWTMAQRYPRSGYWFPGSDHGRIPAGQLSARVASLFTSMGIKGGIHRCRHLYCTRLLRAGVNVRQVQKLMRHSNLETTAAYAAVDEDELRTAINVLPSIERLPEIA